MFTMKKEASKNTYKPTNAGTQKVAGKPIKNSTLRVKKTGKK